MSVIVRSRICWLLAGQIRGQMSVIWPRIWPANVCWLQSIPDTWWVAWSSYSLSTGSPRPSTPLWTFSGRRVFTSTRWSPDNSQVENWNCIRCSLLTPSILSQPPPCSTFLPLFSSTRSTRQSFVCRHCQQHHIMFTISSPSQESIVKVIMGLLGCEVSWWLRYRWINMDTPLHVLPSFPRWLP